MLWFKKKKRKYPAVYSEWLCEFKRLEGHFISEDDFLKLTDGGLEDAKYNLENFARELGRFLEKQFLLFSEKYRKAVTLGLDDGSAEYIILMIRRHTKEYENLFFFERMDFLDRKFRKTVADELREKLRKFNSELIEYFDKVAECVPSMSYVSLNLRRIS